MQILFFLALIPLLLVGMALFWLRYLWAALFSPARALRLAISGDQLANSALNGDEDKTISHRAAIAREEGKRWGCVLCGLLDKLDPGHCDKSRGI